MSTCDRRSFADRTFSGSAQLPLLAHAPDVCLVWQGRHPTWGRPSLANTWDRETSRLRGLRHTPSSSTLGHETGQKLLRAAKPSLPATHRATVNLLSTRVPRTASQLCGRTGRLATRSSIRSTLYADGKLAQWVTACGPRH